MSCERDEALRRFPPANVQKLVPLTLRDKEARFGQVPQVQRSTLPEPLDRQIRIELRKLPAYKLREAYDKLRKGEPTGTDIIEQNRAHALNAIAEILWERGKLSPSELEKATK